MTPVTRALPFVVELALVLYALIDCLQTDEILVRNLPKIVWVFIILLFPFVGPIAWLVAGRPERTGPARGTLWGPRQQAQRKAPPRPRGPDDDPDFLKGL